VITAMLSTGCRMKSGQRDKRRLFAVCVTMLVMRATSAMVKLGALHHHGARILQPGHRHRELRCILRRATELLH